MAITLQEISRVSGYSLPTISQILNDKGKLYKPETRTKVLNAAKTLGYKPNASARSIANQSFDCVALLLSTEKRRSYLPGSRLDGIGDALDKQNYHLSIMKLPDEQLCDDGFMPKALREWMSDGLLVNYNAYIPPKMIELIQNHNIPAVWIDTKRDSDCVYSADLQASEEAGDYLISLGHRRIGYAHYSVPRSHLDNPVHYAEVDRFLGAKQTLAKTGIDLQVYMSDDAIPRSERISYSKAWLAKPDRPTAIITYANTTAMPIIIAAMELGLKIPEDLSVITFAGNNVADESGIAITSMIISEYEVGTEAAKMILEKIETPEKIFAPRQVKLHFKPGKTDGVSLNSKLF